MNYEFPVISAFSDVEPYIDDYFIVKEKEGVIYINYKHLAPEVFPPVVDYGTAVRREFRGIAFDAETGKIISRPFHKFFNLWERDEEGSILESDEYWIEEKLDGSMIRPIPTADGFRLATKAGVTDIAMMAESYIADKPDYIHVIKRQISQNQTPIFEYVGPHNKVVLDYGEDLILLAIRDNFTGQYIDFIPDLFWTLGINVRRDLDEVFLSGEDQEGVVVCQPDGHRQKVKTEWYLQRHKAKELLSNERRFVRLYLDDGIDDVLPLLSSEDKQKTMDLLSDISSAIKESAKNLDTEYEWVRRQFWSKKDLALSTDPSVRYKNVMFGLWDGKFDDGEDALWKLLEKNLSAEDKYQQFKKTYGVEWSIE